MHPNSLWNMHGHPRLQEVCKSISKQKFNVRNYSLKGSNLTLQAPVFGRSGTTKNDQETGFQFPPRMEAAATRQSWQGLLWMSIMATELLKAQRCNSPCEFVHERSTVFIGGSTATRSCLGHATNPARGIKRLEHFQVGCDARFETETRQTESGGLSARRN